jgi:hypothetical protein
MRARARKLNFAILAMSAAAWAFPVTSPRMTAGGRPQTESLDVAANVHARPTGRRARPRFRPSGALGRAPLHGLRKILLLLVEARVVDRERGLRPSVCSDVDALALGGLAGSSEAA